MRHTRRRGQSLLALAAFSLIAPVVQAAGLTGVWRGTLGDAAIVACFDVPYASADGAFRHDHGAYYYKAHQYRIELSSNAARARWSESPYWWSGPTGDWQQWHAQGQVLAATWVSADGTRSAPIRLRRDPEGKEGCDSAAFESGFDGRTRTSAVFAPPLGDLSGHRPAPLRARLRYAVGGSIAVLQFEGDDGATQRINAALRARMDEELRNRSECTDGERQGGWSFEADRLTFLSPRFLAVRTRSEWFCFGPYPDSSLGTLTFDRHSGDPIEPADWIASVEHAWPPDLLRRVREAGMRMREPEDECRDTWADESNFAVWPVPGGLVFEPEFPHVVQACEEEVLLDWETLEPYLSDAGRAARGK